MERLTATVQLQVEDGTTLIYRPAYERIDPQVFKDEAKQYWVLETGDNWKVTLTQFDSYGALLTKSTWWTYQLEQIIGKDFYKVSIHDLADLLRSKV